MATEKKKPACYLTGEAVIKGAFALVQMKKILITTVLFLGLASPAFAANSITPTGWTCDYSVPTHADGTPASTDYTNTFQFTHADCIVTASSSPDIATGPQGVLYGDWLFVMVLILFCVAFIPVGTLFSLIPRKR